ncbi:MAG: hypothetical protein QM820_01190 [Minicystis sp.]
MSVKGSRRLGPHWKLRGRLISRDLDCIQVALRSAYGPVEIQSTGSNAIALEVEGGALRIALVQASGFVGGGSLYRVGGVLGRPGEHATEKGVDKLVTSFRRRRVAYSLSLSNPRCGTHQREHPDWARLSFDHDRVYYRVVGPPEHRGYIYRSGEMERIATGEGLLVAEAPFFELGTIEDAGYWLFLGDRVRRLRIPMDANVVKNVSMSQGGCYPWSTDRVEVLGEIDVAGLVRDMDRTRRRIRWLHLEGLDLPAGFAFPRRAERIYLDRCRAAHPITFPATLRSLMIRGCALRVASLPADLDELHASDSTFEGLTELPPVERGEVRDCVFVAARSGDGPRTP